jgi:hypothetical protein
MFAAGFVDSSTPSLHWKSPNPEKLAAAGSEITRKIYKLVFRKGPGELRVSAGFAKKWDDLFVVAILI